MVMFVMFDQTGGVPQGWLESGKADGPKEQEGQ